ncbi:MAG: hypothetical protein M1445_04340 [Bacteroidetes bacterium]|nr:hypothetical protein [Bacteroidota bacterium]MCL6102237.1 hypothetical protein [Bacteroidota bacterium]
MSKQTSNSQRYLALDVLRGMTVALMIMGVLQRIALAYGFSALIVLAVGSWMLGYVLYKKKIFIKV